MKTAAGSSYKSFLIHCGVWALYMLYEASIILYSHTEGIIWTEMFLAFLLNAGVFYATSGVVWPCCARKRRWLFLPLGLLLVTGVYLLLSYAETTYLFPWVDPHSKEALASHRMYIARHVYRASNFIVLGTGYWFARRAIRKEKALRLVEQDRYLRILMEEELSKELAISQLQYYRARLNPHFLFNTLNFFFANIRELSKPLGEAMLLFSQTIRYTILQDQENGMARLADEIKQMKNYIELNQLRFRHALHLKMTVKVNPGNVSRLSNISNIVLMQRRWWVFY